MEQSILFTKIKIGTLELKNRFVMPAMNSHMTCEHKYTQDAVAYYTERAKGGFGLCITEFMAVDPNGLGSLRQPGIWSDDFIPTLKKLTDSVHAAGGKIFAQLQHSGYQSKSDNLQYIPGAVSDMVNENGQHLKAYSISEIKKLENKFIQAAERAKKAGFDGVEIHGAHGYLLTQFMSCRFNHRTDEYGGGYENRFRIAANIIKGVKAVCGEDFPVSFRLNAVDGTKPGDSTLQDNTIFAGMAEEAGADAIHVSYGIPITSYFYQPGFNENNAQEIKKSVRIPVMVVGRINNGRTAEQIIRAGKADLVTLGRESICDPHFPEKLMKGKENLIFQCIGCMQRCNPQIGCEEGDDNLSCMLNPFTGKELRWKLNETTEPKRILVAGAGCAGMQAAWILAARGHEVTVCEKEKEAGGNLIAAAMPDGKNGFLQYIYTLKEHCKEYHVAIQYECEVTKELIEEKKPDLVIAAMGAEPWAPPIEGTEGKTYAQDILMNRRILTGKKVAILGGGSVGLETAEYLMQRKNQVDVIEMKEQLAEDMVASIREELLERMAGKVTCYTGVKVCRIDGKNQLHVIRNGNKEILSGYDEVILAMGYRSVAALECEEIPVIPIGDAKKARSAKMAIYEATKVGITL